MSGKYQDKLKKSIRLFCRGHRNSNIVSNMSNMFLALLDDASWLFRVGFDKFIKLHVLKSTSSVLMDEYSAYFFMWIHQIIAIVNRGVGWSVN